MPLRFAGGSSHWRFVTRPSAVAGLSRAVGRPVPSLRPAADACFAPSRGVDACRFAGRAVCGSTVNHPLSSPRLSDSLTPIRPVNTSDRVQAFIANAACHRFAIQNPLSYAFAHHHRTSPPIPYLWMRRRNAPASASPRRRRGNMRLSLVGRRRDSGWLRLRQQPRRRHAAGHRACGVGPSCLGDDRAAAISALTSSVRRCSAGEQRFADR